MTTVNGQKIKRSQLIQQFDPVKDCCQICRLLIGYEFPWDVTRALELALFRTFCVPSIGNLLHQTQEFERHTQKRYDDTGLIVSSLFKWGFDTEQGQAALQRMNKIHAHFPINNNDYIYVLSTFIYEPVRWIEKFGWRDLGEVEKEGIFQFWYQVGQQMGIKNIPDTYATLEQYNRDYETQYFRYSPGSKLVGEATIKLFISWFPAPLQPIIKPFSTALFDDLILNTFGFDKPSPLLRQTVEIMLRSRGRLLYYLPPRQTPDFYVDQHQRSYPKGFTLQDLGPESLLQKLNQED